MPPTLPASHQPFSLPQPLDLRSLLLPISRHAPHSISSAATRSLNPASLSSLFRRQVVTVTATAVTNPIIPAYYSGLNSGPQPPGVVAGIVFGSVGGFLLLLWLIYTCFTFGNNTWGRSSVVAEETTVRRRSRSSRHSHRSSRTRSEVIEVERRERSRSRSKSRSRSRTPPRSRSVREERIIVEETIRRPPPPPRSEHEDVVEVFEDHSPVRTERIEVKKEKKRDSGFRTVDPESFGGGDRPYRKVSRGR